MASNLRKITSEDGQVLSRTYKELRGVDFSNDETMVNLSRSPNAVNVWKDYNSALGQAVETRPGIRVIKKFDKVSNLGVDYHAKVIKEHFFMIDDNSYFIAHVLEYDLSTNKYKGKLYQWTNYPAEPATFTALQGTYGVKSNGFLFNKGYYFLDGENFYKITASSQGVLSCEDVRDIAFVPTVAIVTKDGTMNEYQDYNVLTGKQKNQFTGDGTKTVFQFYPSFVDREIYNDSVTIDGVNTTGYTISNYAEDSNGVLSSAAFKITFTTAPSNDSEIVFNFEQALMANRQVRTFIGTGIQTEFDLEPNVAYTTKSIRNLSVVALTGEISEYELQGDKVVFTTAPSTTTAIKITFEQVIKEEAAENSFVKYCDKAVVFDNRVFMANCGSAKTKFFFSALNEPTYFPNNNFEYAGAEELDVVDLVVMNNSIALIKKGNGQNGYLYNISGFETSDELMPKAYRATLISSSIGGIGGAINFKNDIVFLSKSGLQAITQLDLHNERNIAHRSSLVDGKLINESGLDAARLQVFGDYLMVLINGHIYLANSRETTAVKDNEYEWYFWTDIGNYMGDFMKAISLKVVDKALYFGTENGCILKLNNDMLKTLNDVTTPIGTGELTSKAYQDDCYINNALSKRAIYSCWCTPIDDFGYRNRFKRCNKKGSIADLKSFAHSVAKLSIKTDTGFYQENSAHNGGYFDFSDLDFSDFTFNTSDKNEYFFKAKNKKWARISLKFYSDETTKPFGIFGVTLEAILGGYAKEKQYE